jgi:Ras-related protein Rab-1A
VCTIDFQIRTVEIDANRCKLQIWDTAGQDRFKCVVSSFYRGAHGVMICFDITDLESFRNVSNWLEEIKRFCPEKTPVFLVGTKSDLEIRRMIPYGTIKAFAEKEHLSYIETSSKSNENIEQCFIRFARTLVQHTSTMEAMHKINKVDNVKIDLHRSKSITQSKLSTNNCFGDTACTI